jgi:hypothetical protein
MSITLDETAKIIGLLGTGGIFGGVFTLYLRILWERNSSALTKKQEFKEARYKCVIILMYDSLDFKRHRHQLERHRPDLKSLGDVLTELQTEWHNMILFASDDVLKAMHSFIQSPSVSYYKKTVLAMRKDLWGGKLSDDIQSLEFDFKSIE